MLSLTPRRRAANQFFIGIHHIDTSMSDLEGELKAIKGIGDATAAEVLSVMEEHTDSTDIDTDTLEEAYDYLRQNKTREARRRMEDALDL